MTAFIKVVWQLPQLMIGFIITRFLEYDSVSRVWLWNSKSGVSLGKYICVNRKCSLNTIRHERGHSKQSLMLGPSYLIIIGLPSLVGNITHRFIKFDYYKQPWERWADKLGGVVRD